MERNKDSLLGDLAVDGLTRAKEFDNVLRYYFGNEWEAVYEAMKMTPAVTNYLQHLVDIEVCIVKVECPCIAHWARRIFLRGFT